MTKRFVSGDTIVEVMIAIAIFGMVVVAALSIMSGGVNTTQRSLENILVRQQMDSQAATLRFMHNAYMAAQNSSPSAPAIEWSKITTYVETNRATGVVPGSTATVFGTTCSAPTGSFILNPNTATMTKMSPTFFIGADTHSMIDFDSSGNVIAKGIWVEGVKNLAGQNYIDFHIRACWYTAGQSNPATLGTIVRLTI